MQLNLCLTLAVILWGCSLNAQETAVKPIRVLVWDEQQPEQKQAYDNFLGNAIVAHLEKQTGLRVLGVHLASPEQGLDNATLEATDVLIWWGHKRHGEVEPDRCEMVVKRVLEGKLGFIALHSAHFAQPFMRLMHEKAKIDAPTQLPENERATARFDFSLPLKRGLLKPNAPLTPSMEKVGNVWRLTPPTCVFPAWRADGAPSHVTTLLPEHPLARGLPKQWDIPRTEMYNEPFHIPKPDAVVFEERWDKGEHFRSGCAWQISEGRVFYFRPGHETYPIYKQAENLLVIENAVRWVAPQ